MIRRLWRWLTRPDGAYVSADWLSHQDRLSDRVEFHGVSVRWPIKKHINESPRWNAKRLRRSA